MDRLDELAARINAGQDKLEGKARDMISIARDMGEALNEAKSRCGHGNWGPWIDENCPRCGRQSQRYMRIANHWDELEGKLENHNVDSISGAMELLSDQMRPARRISDDDSWDQRPLYSSNLETSLPDRPDIPMPKSVVGELVDEDPPASTLKYMSLDEADDSWAADFLDREDRFITDLIENERLIEFAKKLVKAADEAGLSAVRSVLSQPVDKTAELSFLIRWWNNLAHDIEVASVQADPISKGVHTSYNRFLKHRELQEAFADLDALEDKIRSSSFVHGQGWFTLPKLLSGANADGEYIVTKLLNGGYDGQLSSSTKESRSVANARKLIGKRKLSDA